jgi:hypothetical protein
MIFDLVMVSSRVRSKITRSNPRFNRALAAMLGPMSQNADRQNLWKPRRVPAICNNITSDLDENQAVVSETKGVLLA